MCLSGQNYANHYDGFSEMFGRNSKQSFTPWSVWETFTAENITSV